MQMQWESPCEVQPDLILAADVLYDPGKCLVSYAAARLRSCIPGMAACLANCTDLLCTSLVQFGATELTLCNGFCCSHNCTIGIATETVLVQC